MGCGRRDEPRPATMLQQAARMFHRLTAAVFLSTLMLVSASAQTSLPADVARYLERRESCDHWRGEDGYDAERQAYIKWATCQSCPGSDAGLATLKRKYAENPRVLAALLEDAREPAPPGLPLSVAFADELPEAFTPPDELVEGVLTAGDGSVLYGDSNSGKTFLVIDMAAAVARGAQWMGRNTEPGLVVYLAAESPASVRGRLQAYQRHHGVRVPNFAIVQSPIDLFDGDADTEAVIAVVRQLERQRGQKVRLIVGDTLARLSAGANENAGQDMGLVVRRFDRIRSACNAHFLLIHHSGKAAANGARGWSGIRAAVDTEIEVTDSPTGRCAEITKQRDLSTKGERIGFRLDTVTLGTTKWGAAATSCVVVPADAPDKPQGKRVSEVGGAVLEYLRTQPAGKKKREVVEHFQPLYDKSAVYRELKKLVTAGQVLECIGIVTAVSEVRNGAK
mgnify:CR=1 FL=1